MLDESYEDATSVAKPKWKDREVERRQNHDLTLAQKFGRRRQSWMSGGKLGVD